MNLVLPALIPVISPLFWIVATNGSRLVHIPPVVGVMFVVVPIQISSGPVKEVPGFGLTVIGSEGLETQPVLVSLKVKVAVPADIAVINPLLSIEATEGSELDQTPPDEGRIWEVSPMQIASGPLITIVGSSNTITGAVLLELHPAALVNVNLAKPWLTPVTTPALVTVATDGLSLVQVPPELGNKVVVLPIQIVFGPSMDTLGFGRTVTGEESSE